MVYSHLPPFEDAKGQTLLELLIVHVYASSIIQQIIHTYKQSVLRRTSSLTREEILHILETVHQNKCAPICFFFLMCFGY